jgi:hypothetical protein
MIKQGNMEKMDREWVSGVYGTVQCFHTSNRSFQRFSLCKRASKAIGSVLRAAPSSRLVAAIVQRQVGGRGVRGQTTRRESTEVLLEVLSSARELAAQDFKGWFKTMLSLDEGLDSKWEVRTRTISAAESSRRSKER